MISFKGEDEFSEFMDGGTAQPAGRASNLIAFDQPQESTASGSSPFDGFGEFVDSTAAHSHRQQPSQPVAPFNMPVQHVAASGPTSPGAVAGGGISLNGLFSLYNQNPGTQGGAQNKYSALENLGDAPQASGFPSASGYSTQQPQQPYQAQYATVPSGFGTAGGMGGLQMGSGAVGGASAGPAQF